MKNRLFTLVFAVIAALSIITLTACDKGAESQVNLVGISSGADVVARDDIDYFVVPEPAASLRVKAAGLHFVGDLQKLYGGENGYPQAVIVVKNDLLNSDGDFVKAFVDGVKANKSWLETAEISTVVNAVNNHLTDGMMPIFDANNLTKSVIDNCGIRFTSASESKAETKSFLSSLKAIQPSVKDDPADGFFFDGNFAQTSDESKTQVSVYAPDGAPALAIANLLAGEVQFSKTVNYEIVNAQLIQNFVTGNAQADICILPVNLASNLLGTNKNYTMLGTVTHGNLYILSAKDEGEITLDKLKGKTVAVVNLGAVPGLTLKLILKNNGLEYAENAE